MSTQAFLAFAAFLIAPAPQSAVLSGRVVDVETRKPVARAGVQYHAHGEAGDDVQSGGLTDANGRFEFKVKPGYWLLYLTPPNEFDPYPRNRPAAMRQRSFSVRIGEHVKLGDVPIFLRPRKRVRGSVRTADGQPAPGAEILLYRRQLTGPGSDSRAGDRLDRLERAHADANGRFDISRGDAGMTMGLRAIWQGMHTTSDVTLDYEPANQTVDLVVKPEAMAVLSGRVLMPDGTPAKGASVDLRPVYPQAPSAEDPRVIKTAADGRFRFEVWPRDSYVIYAGVGEELRYRSAPVRPDPGRDTEIPDMRLQAGLSMIDVECVHPLGKKLHALTSEFAPPHQGPLPSPPQGGEGPNRRRFEGLSPGIYHLRFWGQGFWADEMIPTGKEKRKIVVHEGRPPWFPPQNPPPPPKRSGKQQYVAGNRRQATGGAN